MLLSVQCFVTVCWSISLGKNILKQYCDYWRLQAKWWGSRSLEWWAAHITVVYVGGAILIMGSRFEELIVLKLNEIGDLAAGVFGPLAFLWLVLGYIQQGRELKLSSQALLLQAHELKESVKQQTELNHVTRESLRNQNLTLEPVFHIHFESMSDDFIEGDRYENAHFSLHNVGAQCEHVAVCVMANDRSELIAYHYPLVDRDSKHQLTLVDILYQGDVVELRVSFIRLNGASGTQIFDLEEIPSFDEGEPYVRVSKRILAL
ncbi:hypothetical protein [Pseudomonas sp. ACN5]|uniref:hypothetical protein n=1 Tax=Pseudomonas sp. ACN5 TaxID=1920427 RepID=UPI00114320AB|nr:hypothetical protein [Pseudomonas sp. ACN5]PBJ02049.1 hypothetical protein BSF40_51480 [Pseudomonas sp. ACN5]